MTLLFAYLLISIFFSFLCSLLEAVLLSITPSYVNHQEQKGSSIAQDLSRYKADIDRPLSAILTLNTIAHTAGAVGVGSQAAALFGEHYLRLFDRNIINIEALIAVAMTLAILVISEVIPKTLGANNWQSLAPVTVRTLKVMLIVLAPLVWLLQLLTRNLKKDKDKPVLTRNEFLAMAELGKESGVLKENEQLVIQNLLRFNRIQVKDVMTPRIVVLQADENLAIRQFHEENENLSFSRVPVYQGHTDMVTGYILRDELLVKLIEAEDGDTTKLKDLRRDIIVVPKNLPIPNLLDRFIDKKEHIALAVDEFGGMEGVVTMEDIIETLLGLEIVDESDDEEDMQDLARKNWEQRAKRMGIIPTDKS